MKHFAAAALLFALLALPATAAADEIVLKGGSTLTGVVLADGPAQVTLLSPAGDLLHLKRPDVARVVRDAKYPQPGQYTRYVPPTNQEAGGLDVAITYYKHPKGGARIDLVGAVHIADRAFYREVQKVLEDAGTVLYEGIKDKATTNAEFDRGPQDEKKSYLRGLQERMARWLGLDFQLDGVTYRRPHFVHADMTTEAFEGVDEKSTEAAKAASRGGIFAYAKFMSGLMKIAGPLFDLLLGNKDKAGPLREGLKRSMAQTLGATDMEDRIRKMDPEMAALILDRRNEVAIEILEKQLAAKAKGPIAIFYGAGHMPGLDKLLVTKLGYERVGARWLRAWRVP